LKSKKILALLIISIFILGIQRNNFAQKTSKDTVTTKTSVNSVKQKEEQALKLPGESLGKYVLRMIFYLIVVILLIYGIVFLIKRFVLPSETGGGVPKSVHILGHLYLGPRKALYLIELVNRILVLGVTNNSIQLLTEIKDAETIELLKNEFAPGGVHYQFSQYLKRFLTKEKEA